MRSNFIETDETCLPVSSTKNCGWRSTMQSCKMKVLLVNHFSIGFAGLNFSHFKIFHYRIMLRISLLLAKTGMPKFYVVWMYLLSPHSWFVTAISNYLTRRVFCTSLPLNRWLESKNCHRSIDPQVWSNIAILVLQINGRLSSKKGNANISERTRASEHPTPTQCLNSGNEPVSLYSDPKQQNRRSQRETKTVRVGA